MIKFLISQMKHMLCALKRRLDGRVSFDLRDKSIIGIPQTKYLVIWTNESDLSRSMLTCHADVICLLGCCLLPLHIRAFTWTVSLFMQLC